MKFKNNLSDASENCYFEVTKPFKVLYAAGWYNTNAYIGSTNLVGHLYRWHTVEVGTYLCDLVGGVFASVNGKYLPVKMHLPESSPFVKNSSETLEVYPLDCLKRISKPEGLDYHTNSNLPQVDKPENISGSNLDYIE